MDRRLPADQVHVDGALATPPRHALRTLSWRGEAAGHWAGDVLVGVAERTPHRAAGEKDLVRRNQRQLLAVQDPLPVHRHRRADPADAALAPVPIHPTVVGAEIAGVEGAIGEGDLVIEESVE